MLGEKKDDKVWKDVNKGDNLEQGFYKANCSWCTTSWSRGRPYDMKVHLARYCDNAPNDIKIKWQDYLAEETSKTNSLRKSVKQLNITIHYQQITPISDTKPMNLINQFLKHECVVASCNSVLEFFNRSHIANSHYKEQMVAIKIKGGAIQLYTKTRWGSLYTTTDSIIRSKPVFDWLLENCTEIISNNNVFGLLQNEEFYSKCHQIASILKPVKELTNILEACNADLAGCFIGLTRLAT
ncbi:27365_t:CDS:2, partial [Gigaspora margarita]